MSAFGAIFDANTPTWAELPDWLYLVGFSLLVYGGGFVVVPTLGWWVGTFRRWWLSALFCAVALPVQAMLG